MCALARRVRARDMYVSRLIVNVINTSNTAISVSQQILKTRIKSDDSMLDRWKELCMQSLKKIYSLAVWHCNYNALMRLHGNKYGMGK